MILFVIPWCGLSAVIDFQSGFIATTNPDGAGLEMEFMEYEVVHCIYIYIPCTRINRNSHLMQTKPIKSCSFQTFRE